MEDAEPNALANATGYHEALGLFIEEFASTEAMMHMLLCHYAKLSSGVAQVIFSDTPLVRTIEHIKRLVAINEHSGPHRRDLDATLKQLKSISKVRNSIMHFVTLSGIPGDERHLVDARSAMTERTRRIVSTPMLAEMADDLRKIQIHIWYHLSIDRMPGFAVAMLDEVRLTPWRYTAPSSAPSPEGCSSG